MERTTTVLWDWNGTLLDDVELCASLLDRLLEAHGYPPLGSLEAYRSVFRFPIVEYYRDAGFDLERHPFEQLAQEYMDLYLPESEACPLMPQARSVLEAVRSLELRQVILSASPVDTLCRQVTARDIAPYFEQLLGLGDIYAHSKVELGRAWMRRSGICPGQALMVGDSVHDFEVAQAMGARCVLYSGGHQPRAVLQATGAPVIGSLLELP